MKKKIIKAKQITVTKLKYNAKNHYNLIPIISSINNHDSMQSVYCVSMTLLANMFCDPFQNGNKIIGKVWKERKTTSSKQKIEYKRFLILHTTFSAAFSFCKYSVSCIIMYDVHRIQTVKLKSFAIHEERIR